MTKTKVEQNWGVRSLRLDAYHAYLDGRVSRAKELNKRADALEAQLRRAALHAEFVASLAQPVEA